MGMGGLAGLRAPLPDAAPPPPQPGAAPGAARLPLPDTDTPWMLTASTPGLLDLFDWLPGTLIEVPTYAPGSPAPDGTAVFEIIERGVPDVHGRPLRVVTRGASVPLRAVELDPLFSPGGWAAAGGCIHLCRQGMAHCSAVIPGELAVLHVEIVRLRSRAGLAEPWVRLPPAPGAAVLPADGPGQAAGAVTADASRAQERTEAAELRARVRSLQDELDRALDGNLGRPAAVPADRARRPSALLADRASARVASSAGSKRDRDRSRKRRCRRDSSSSSSGSSRDRSLFHHASSHSGNSIRALATKQPGALYDAGLKEITQVMGLREGATNDDGSAATFLGYLTAILLGQYPADKMGLRSARELQTLARALDHLGAGRLPEVADLLMQRFKAVEQYLHDGNWNIASQMEIVPDTADTLASAKEQHAAARAELLRSKLDEARRRGGR